MTQKQQLLKMFAENGNRITLGQIMKTNLGAEYRARISDLRNEGKTIVCTEKPVPSDNVYDLIEVKPEPPEVAEYRRIMRGYSENHNQIPKIQAQIEKILNKC